MIRPTIWLNDAMSQQQIAPVHHDDDGSTPAAWTTVISVMVACVVGTLAIGLGNWAMVWVGVALVVGAVVAGKALGRVGVGKKAS